jgi:hypothetical protein
MFIYQKEENWPTLAWLAICNEDNESVTIRHGPDVDTRLEWFCEAVWDDEYSDGGFDRSNTVFGSGGRIRQDRVNFVASSFPADRLQYIEINKTIYISNSLVCLAAALDLHVDPWYPWYYEDFFSIADGLHDYRACINTDRGEVTFVYCNNLSWNGKQLSTYEKPKSALCFHDFDSYQNFLSATLKRLLSNMHSAERPYIYDSISTSSSGYDSLAVTVLSRQLDTHQVICVPDDRIGFDDSGIELIQKLGMEALTIKREAWRKEPFAEISFIASDACGRDAWLFAARDHLPRKFLLTGYFGDSIWRTANKEGGKNAFTMGSPGGLSMTEFRLQYGFIHCPVPYLGIEHIDTIRAIASGDEMQPWALNEYYDRPIPRRIIEEAGLKRGSFGTRNSFGTRKTAVNVHLFRRKEFDRFLAGMPSFRDYMSWIRKQSQLAPPPTEEYPLTVPAREQIEVPLFRQLFPWALERSKLSYKT